MKMKWFLVPIVLLGLLIAIGFLSSYYHGVEFEKIVTILEWIIGGSVVLILGYLIYKHFEGKDKWSNSTYEEWHYEWEARSWFCLKLMRDGIRISTMPEHEIKKKIEETEGKDITYKYILHQSCFHPEKDLNKESWMIYCRDIEEQKHIIGLLEFWRNKEEPRMINNMVADMGAERDLEKFFTWVDNYYQLGTGKTRQGMGFIEKIYQNLPQETKEDPDVLETVVKSKDKKEEDE